MRKWRQYWWISTIIFKTIRLNTIIITLLSKMKISNKLLWLWQCQLPVALHPLILTCIVYQIHKGEESRYFCRPCNAAVCTLCIIEDHGEHDVVITEVMYKQQMEAASELKQSIHDKATLQRVVKADLEAVHSSIHRSCEQVCSLYHLKC